MKDNKGRRLTLSQLEGDLAMLDLRLGGQTLEQIAEDYGISRERVRQRQNRALSYLPNLSDLVPLGLGARRKRKVMEAEPARHEMLAEYRELRASMHRKPRICDLSNPEAARALWRTEKELAIEAAGGDPEAAYAHTRQEGDWWFDHVRLKLGRPPTFTDMREHCDPSVFLRHHSSWSEYVYSRGHWPHCSNNPVFMKEVLKANYRVVKERLGYVPNSLELGRLGAYSMGTYTLHWGGYAEFLRQVGDAQEYQAQKDPDDEKHHPPGWSKYRWSRKKVKNTVLEMARELGRTPTLKELRHERGLNVTTISNYHGPYSSLCRELGLEPNRPGKKKGETQKKAGARERTAER